MIANYILIAVGFIEWVIGACLSTEEFWIVPPVLFLAGTLTLALGLHLISKRAEKEYQRVIRHCEDADKQQDSDEISAAYQELILNEIWQ